MHTATHPHTCTPTPTHPPTSQVARPLVQHTLRGYNACCFAYGQTGSGKTYSMFGEGGPVRGIIPRAVEDLFRVVKHTPAQTEVTVLVTFLEIYCDQIRDLGKSYV